MQTSYIKRIKLFLFGDIINILLTELGRSVWENLDLGRRYRPHFVRSVLATSVKILPYRPPARLIRTNYRLIQAARKGELVTHDLEIPKDFKQRRKAERKTEWEEKAQFLRQTDSKRNEKTWAWLQRGHLKR